MIFGFHRGEVLAKRLARGVHLKVVIRIRTPTSVCRIHLRIVRLIRCECAF